MGIGGWKRASSIKYLIICHLPPYEVALDFIGNKRGGGLGAAGPQEIPFGGCWWWQRHHQHPTRKILRGFAPQAPYFR